MGFLNQEGLERLWVHITSKLSEKASKESPALTGIPTAPTASAETNSTQIATTAYVTTAINNVLQASNAMVFKGTIGTNGTVTSLPNSHQVGDVYVVSTSNTYAGQVCEIGDMVVCTTTGTVSKDSDWTVVQSNINGAVTGPSNAVASHVATFDGSTGKVIKDSGFTIGASVPSNAKFTDTHYASKNVVGSSTATNNTTSALTNGNVYLNSVENGAITSSHKISGSGATTVTTDSSGNIVISSTDIPSKTSQLTNDSGFITGYTETDPTVPEWAKQATKPSYTASEVGALPSSTVIPSKTSQLTNDSGYITGYTETDPTVPAWAKAASKPSYSAAEVGAIPTSASCNKNWNWSGQGGQPTWLWGGEDGTNMYVYNPANFTVNYANGANHANEAGNADTVDGWHMNLDPGSWGIKPVLAGTGDMVSGSTGLSNGYIYLVYE